MEGSGSVLQEFDPEVPVIEAIQQGDAGAMEEFVHRQGQFVRSVVYGSLRRTNELDDVVQRVWLRVWREARRLDDPTRWRAWLYRIARNAALDAGRKRQRWRDHLQQWWQRPRPGSAQTPPDVTAERQESHQLVLDAIESLPTIYRECFVLKHVEQLSYRQISEMLGVPTDTVETRLVRARRQLRDKLTGHL